MRENNQQQVMATCPTENTLRILDGKWKIAILQSLMHENVMRFGELKRLMPRVTQRMLTAQLRELEACGIVTRKVYPVVPPKVEYSLTDLGKTLRPVFDALREWSIAHDHELADQ
jgi:DNA-binding HxlR family transcriptional regulator